MRRLHFQAGAERNPILSAPNYSKVATDIYDSDDAGPDRTPPLVPRVVPNLRPSPSPEIVPPPAKSVSPDRMSRSPRHKGRKRRPKTQASQGDAVLIGFLGGLNNPDIAIRAGEEPLNSASQSESGEMGEDMEGDEGNKTDKKNHLVQAAQDALSVDSNEDKTSSSTPETTRRVRPKIMTQSLAPKARDRDRNTTSETSGQERRAGEKTTVKAEGIDTSVGGLIDIGSSQRQNPPNVNRRRGSSGTRDLSPLATSPHLRQFMASKGSETLPAIQSATPSLSAKSPSGQQNLPSISAQLGELVDGPSPNDSLPSRSTFSTNGIQSPPMSGISQRPNHYPSPQSRLGSFPHPYPASQPSPASTYSEISPREPYRPGHDPTSMSPPGKPGQHPYYAAGRAPQGDEMTPLSAEGYSGSKGFASSVSTNGDHISIEPGRHLPPLPGTAPLMTGNFKCDHPSCTAAPFQTQYLLK